LHHVRILMLRKIPVHALNALGTNTKEMSADWFVTVGVSLAVLIVITIALCSHNERRIPVHVKSSAPSPLCLATPFLAG